MYTKASAGSPAPVAPEFFAQRDAEIARRFEFLLRFFTPRTGGVRPPTNLRVLRAGGLAAIPPGSVDVAFSEEPRDPERVHRVLSPNGIYFVCGLLPAQLFREAGFARVVYYAGRARVPASLAKVSRATTVAAHK